MKRSFLLTYATLVAAQLFFIQTMSSLLILITLYDNRDFETPQKRGRKRKVDYEDDHQHFNRKYFGRRLNSSCVAKHFRMIHRIWPHQFLLLEQKIMERDPFFKRQVDSLGQQGIFPRNKLLACFRRLGSGLSFADFGDFYGFSTATAQVYFKRFIKVLPLVLDGQLKPPTDQEVI